MAKELEAVSVLSSRNLQQTLSSLSSSIDLLLVEEVLDDDDDADFKDNDDIDDKRGLKKDQKSEDEEIEVKDNEEHEGIKKDGNAEYEEKEKDKDEEDEEGDEDDGPLFALYCGGETSVIAGLGQENGYYQVGPKYPNFHPKHCSQVTVRKTSKVFIFSLSKALIVWHCRWRAT